MEVDDGVGAELGFQGLLDLVGARVGGTEREEPVHADVQLDGATVADAAGAQMMRVADVGEGGDDVEYLALLLLGEGGFHQFVEALLEQSPRHAQDEEGHDDGGQGVEDRPAVAEEDGAADAHEGAEGGEGVAAVMPGVGLDGGRVEGTATAHGVLVDKLFQHHGDHGGPERQHAGGGEDATPAPEDEGFDALVADAHGHQGQGEADEGGGKGLVLAVAVAVAAVFGLAADADEEEHHGVGEEVREGMDGVGGHGGAVAEEAGDELEDGQEDVDGAADQGDSVDFFLSVHLFGG